MKKLKIIDYYKLTLILLLFGTLTVVLFCFRTGISGNDFWWHIKVGEYVWQNKAVPTTDIFSWIGMEKGISWTAHEWLSDVIFYFIYNGLGEVGIFLFSITLSLIMTGLLCFQIRQYFKKNILIAGVYLAFFSVLTSLFFYGRPHIFSFFFLFFELKILYDFIEKKNEKTIYFIPIISILWSNFHGGSSNLSYILCFVFLLIGLININIGTINSVRLEKKSIIKLSLVSMCSVLGIFINPIGYKVFAYPYESFADNISMNIISEWAAPDAKLIGNLLLYFIPIAIFVFCMISEKRSVRLIDVTIMALFLFLFFRSSRFIILWYIATAFYAFRYVPECKVKPINTAVEKISVWICLLLVSIPFCISLIDIYDLVKGPNIISTVISQDAVSEIKEDAPKRLFNDYNIGETLIYNDIPVFFDARADLYAQENIMADGVTLLYLEQANNSSKIKYVDVEKLVENYEFDAMLILKSRPLYSYLFSHGEEYQLLYEDNQIGYFRVKKGENNEY